MGTEEGAQELRIKAEAKIGSYPVCKGIHKYQRRLPWESLLWPSDWLPECKSFRALNPQQRSGVIQDQGGCVVCLSWGNHKFRCNMVQRHNEGGPGIECKEREGAGVCGQLHYRLLHRRRSAHASANAAEGLPRRQEGFQQDWFSGKPTGSHLTEGFRQDWFSGKPTGSLLTEGTSGAIFDILEAPVVLTEGKKIVYCIY